MSTFVSRSFIMFYVLCDCVIVCNIMLISRSKKKTKKKEKIKYKYKNIKSTVFDSDNWLLPTFGAISRFGHTSDEVMCHVFDNVEDVKKIHFQHRNVSAVVTLLERYTNAVLLRILFAPVSL